MSCTSRVVQPPSAIALISLTAVLGTASSPRSAAAQGALSPPEAAAIATDAYVYFYPLISMDLTRKQLANTPPGNGIGGPMNTFVNVPTFPPADLKVVVRPNFDTLYSSGWLDLTKEPLVVSRRTPADATISCRCSTCGRMSLHPRDGARPVRRPAIFWSRRLDGTVPFPPG